jgi:hypothetical protein
MNVAIPTAEAYVATVNIASKPTSGRIMHGAERSRDLRISGAHRRRPRWGCPRGPVGTHPHILVVGASNPIAVPCMGRLGVRRGEIRRLRYADQQLSGSLNTQGFSKYHLYTSVKISCSASLIFLFEAGHSSHAILSTGGAFICSHFFGEEGKGGSELAAGVGYGG